MSYPAVEVTLLLATTTSLLTVLLLTNVASAAERVQFGDAVWNVTCPMSHVASDDPIVFPGQSGAAHLHEFFGNKTTNAASNTNSLAMGNADCKRDMDTVDHSAYWAPALLRKDQTNKLTRVEGSTKDQRVAAYYTVSGNTVPVQPFPYGLRMIAGNAKAKAPQPKSVVSYTCTDNSGKSDPSSESIPNCSGEKHVKARVIFPNCWNGRDISAPNHMSHMAYEVNQTCPASHPVKVPELNLMVHYNAKGDGQKYELSSGGQYTMHADFWNVWNTPAQKWLVDNCLNSRKNCVGIKRDEIKTDSNTFMRLDEPITPSTPTPNNHVDHVSQPTRAHADDTVAIRSESETSLNDHDASAAPVSLPKTGGGLGGVVAASALLYSACLYWRGRRQLTTNLHHVRY